MYAAPYLIDRDQNSLVLSHFHAYVHSLYRGAQ